MKHLLLGTVLAFVSASCLASDTAQLPAADETRIEELDWTIKKKIVFPIKVGDLVRALGGEKKLVASSFGAEGEHHWILFEATRPNAAGGVYQLEVTTAAKSTGHLFEHQALGARILYRSETNHVFELVSPFEKKEQKADPVGTDNDRAMPGRV